MRNKDLCWRVCTSPGNFLYTPSFTYVPGEATPSILANGTLAFTFDNEMVAAFLKGQWFNYQLVPIP